MYLLFLFLETRYLKFYRLTDLVFHGAKLKRCATEGLPQALYRGCTHMLIALCGVVRGGGVKGELPKAHVENYALDDSRMMLGINVQGCAQSSHCPPLTAICRVYYDIVDIYISLDSQS